MFPWNDGVILNSICACILYSEVAYTRSYLPFEEVLRKIVFEAHWAQSDWCRATVFHGFTRPAFSGSIA